EYPKVSERRSEPLPRGEHLSPYEKKEVPLKPAAAFLVVASLVLCLDAARPQSGASPAGSLVVGTDAKLLLELETSLHTRTTRVGDRAEFTTTEDLRVGDRVAVPRGSSVRATVTPAQRAGRIAGRAEIRLRFDELRLADGTTLPFNAAVVR